MSETLIGADVADDIDIAINALDAQFGSRADWLDRIDTKLLDMRDDGLCILGQLYGYYGAAPNVLKVQRAFTGSIPVGSAWYHEQYRAGWMAAIADMRRGETVS